MKYTNRLNFPISLMLALATTCISPPFVHAADLYLNLFRNPSIGPELRFKFVSFHTGYYTTIISKDKAGDNVSTEFIRTGISLWPTDYIYISASHLIGVTREWEGKNAGIYEAGLQGLIWNDRIALRLGVAILHSEEIGTKVNPTPGVSIRIPL